MSGLIILILVFVAVPYIWRWLKPYFYRWAQRRTEDYIRNAMGMPPREKKSTRGRSGNDGRQESRSSAYNGYSRHGRSGYGYSRGPLIPKEYAVDVEYTEIRSYSAEQKIGTSGANIRYKVESQVSDAEIIEIRKDR